MQKKIVNPVTTLKYQHRRKTFELLLNQKEISRNDISNVLRVSVQTAMKIIKYFEDYGLAKCIGEKEAEFGRRPQLYSLENNKAFYIGIIHESNIIRAGIVNLGLELVLEESIEMKNSVEEIIVEQTCEIVQILINKLEAKINTDVTILGIGLGLPGVVNENTMEISFAPSLAISKAVNIKSYIEELKTKLHTEIFIENNINAAVLGELKDENDLVYLSLGSGIGIGIILDKKIRRGAHFRSGEIGSLATSNLDNNIENLIGLEALKTKFNFDKTNIDSMNPETKTQMIDFIATETTKIIATTTAILDISDFIVGGLTLDLLGSELFAKIEEKIASLSGYNINLRPQSSSKSPLIGICKKSFDFCVDSLLFLDKLKEESV